MLAEYRRGCGGQGACATYNQCTQSSRQVTLLHIMNGSFSTAHVAQRSFHLVVHDRTPTNAVRSIAGYVRRGSDGTLAVRYVIAADLSRLRIPRPRPKAVAERLWQHTCCELFVQRSGTAAYHEFNFAPSGEWAAYAFEAYRNAQHLMDTSIEPRIEVRTTAETFELDASIRLDGLSPAHVRDALALSVTAVIEESDGRISYWSVAHPLGKPDFHHHDAFAVLFDEIRD